MCSSALGAWAILSAKVEFMLIVCFKRSGSRGLRMLRGIVAVRGAFLDLLQQLCCDRYCNHFRRFVGDAGYADRTRHAADADGIDAPRGQPALELDLLRMRADHAEEREIATPEDAFGECEIERMVMRHHEEVAVGRRFVNGGFRDSAGVHRDVFGEMINGRG